MAQLLGNVDKVLPVSEVTVMRALDLHFDPRPAHSPDVAGPLAFSDRTSRESDSEF